MSHIFSKKKVDNVNKTDFLCVYLKIFSYIFQFDKKKNASYITKSKKMYMWAQFLYNDKMLVMLG
jgi:hypothetical protein